MDAIGRAVSVAVVARDCCVMAEPWQQQPLADLGATSAQLKRRKLRSDITQA